MVSLIKLLVKDFVTLVYPPHCIECNQQIPIREKLFCTNCQNIVGYTDHFEVANNDLIKRIGPRINPEHGAALMNYVKEGAVQNAIHKLKYSGRFDIGIQLGVLFGEAYLSSEIFEKADVIIPIPIHKSRLRKREYNQSEMFANGISSATGIKIDTKLLVKNKYMLSQTQKGRADRFDTVLNTFKVENRVLYKNKRLLLIDDVLTTGATIEAAFSLLEKIPGVKIQLGLIALASN